MEPHYLFNKSWVIHHLSGVAFLKLKTHTLGHSLFNGSALEDGGHEGMVKKVSGEDVNYLGDICILS
jgi:hypothetical protein